MGIREIGYRHWEGKFTSHSRRWLAIARQAAKTVVFTKGRLMMVVGLALLVWIPYFFFGLFWFLEKQTLGGGGTASTFFGADRFLRQQLYWLYQGWGVMVVPLFAAAIISPLVANDLRSNALYIYLSKPLRRIDYVLGKAVAATVWLLPVTFGPSLFVWIMAVASAQKSNRPREAMEVFGEIFVTQLLVVVVLVGLCLALSSLTKRWWVAFATFIGGWYVLWILSQTLQVATHRFTLPNSGRDWILVSGVTNLINVARKVFEMRPDAPPAWAASLWLVIALVLASVGLFLWRILRMEVAE